jgi:pimeloyl-ACP methyl ester carboxylesterase
MTRKIRHRSPNILHTGLEGRWVWELGAHYSLRPLLKRLPKGDGHTVIVFPGFLSSGLSTRQLRRLLKDLGYDARDWGMGRNLRFNAEVEQNMRDMVNAVYDEVGSKVSLVGWSLGGVFAREMARAMPDKVRSVISLGSPITGARHAAVARPIFEMINGSPEPETEARIDKMHVPPPVPTTAIYSKTDGVVHWHGAIQDEGDQAENIRVPASHLGMGSNPIVMYAIADRLSQREGAWAPFEISGLRKFAFQKPKPFNRPLGEFY